MSYIIDYMLEEMKIAEAKLPTIYVCYKSRHEKIDDMLPLAFEKR